MSIPIILILLAVFAFLASVRVLAMVGQDGTVHFHHVSYDVRRAHSDTKKLLRKFRAIHGPVRHA